MLNIALIGATGRMGRMVRRVAIEDDTIVISRLCIYDTHQAIGELQLPDNKILESFGSEQAKDSDIILDFSLPDTIQHNLKTASDAKKPIVLCMTGLKSIHHEYLYHFSKYVPILWAPNTSIGIALLRYLIRQAAHILPSEYDIEVLEMHHRYKRDSPSGTAISLGKAAAAGRNLKHNSVAIFERHNYYESRKINSIGYSSMRGGGIVGDHILSLTNDYEQISLSHRSLDRRLFALGALHATKWLANQKVGLFSIEDTIKSFSMY